jgi:hypothetical protein
MSPENHAPRRRNRKDFGKVDPGISGVGGGFWRLVHHLNRYNFSPALICMQQTIARRQISGIYPIAIPQWPAIAVAFGRGRHSPAHHRVLQQRPGLRQLHEKWMRQGGDDGKLD